MYILIFVLLLFSPDCISDVYLSACILYGYIPFMYIYLFFSTPVYIITLGRLTLALARPFRFNHPPSYNTRERDYYYYLFLIFACVRVYFFTPLYRRHKKKRKRKRKNNNNITLRETRGSPESENPSSFRTPIDALSLQFRENFN